MQYTTNFSLKKPQYADEADIEIINDNSDDIDNLIHQNRTMIAPAFDSTKAYVVGDPVVYLGELFVFIADKAAGAWDATKVEPTTAAEMGGGGASALADLDDVEITNPSTGQALLFDDDDDVWKNQDLPDVSVTKEASGNPIEITDGASAPIVKCVTEIQGSQDLHGYDKPWVGGAGKNLLNPDTITKAGDIDYVNGLWTMNPFDETSQIIILPFTSHIGDSVTVSFTAWASGIASARFDGQPDSVYTSGTDFSDKTLSLTTNKNRFSFSGKILKGTASFRIFRTSTHEGAQTVSVYVENIQIELGSTATSYAPYSNICPITAYTEGEIEVRGKNLFDKDNTESGYLGSDGSVVSSGSFDHEYIPIEGGQTYTVSGINYNGGPYSWWYDANMVPISSFARHNNGTFTAPVNAKYMGINAIVMSNTGHDIDTIQVEKGSTATTYEPYKGITHTTTYPSAIYRGSEDVVNGTETHDMPCVDLGDFAWSYNSTAKTFFTPLGTTAKRYMASEIANALSEKFGVMSNSDITNDLTLDGVFSIHYEAQQSWLNVRWLEYTVASDFKTAVTGTKLAYELATPTTSSVTPTNLPIKSLSGYNHIESSTGDMEVEYIRGNYQPIVDLIESGNGHTYSTQEQVVGKWIDGSEIYEKTIFTTSPSAANTNVAVADLSGLNLGKVLEITGILYASSLSQYIPVLWSYNSSLMGSVYVDGTNLMQILTAANYCNADEWITIRYTKTASNNRSVSLFQGEISPSESKGEELPFEPEKAEEKAVEEPEKEPEKEEPEEEPTDETEVEDER